MKTLKTAARQLLEREAILQGMWYDDPATEELASMIEEEAQRIAQRADRVRRDELMQTVVERHIQRAVTPVKKHERS